ncbi:MAG: hypothetical protein IPL79_17205 [Myxococcales bacterium]|nr:hypothetical protein [Myxococcales bacterium]
MATSTKPCPYCGAMNLGAAAACIACNRPFPAAAAAPAAPAISPPAAGAGPSPARTMFGYAAPKIPAPGTPGAPGIAPTGQPGHQPPAAAATAPTQVQTPIASAGNSPGNWRPPASITGAPPHVAPQSVPHTAQLVPQPMFTLAPQPGLQAAAPPHAATNLPPGNSPPPAYAATTIPPASSPPAPNMSAAATAATMVPEAAMQSPFAGHHAGAYQAPAPAAMAPASQQAYVAPPMQQQQQAYVAPPMQPQQQAYVAPPMQPGQQAYVAPPMQPGQQAYVAPPMQPGQQAYVAPPMQPGQQAYVAPPMQQPSYGQPPTMPPAQSYGGGPAYVGPDTPGPLDDWARKLPSSQRGTLFGHSLDLFANLEMRNLLLMIFGVMLCSCLVLPMSTLGENVWAFSKGVPKFSMLVFPVLAGAFYIAVARNLVSHALVGAALSVVAIVGVFSMGGESSGNPLGSNTYYFGLAALLFGLMARLQFPEAMAPRAIIALGAIFWLVFMIDAVEFIFTFEHMPAFLVIHNLLFFAVLLAGIASGALAVPADKLPPALRSLEAFAPLLTAIVIAWVVIQPILFMLGLMGATTFSHGLVIGLRLIVVAVGYFGVWTLAAPGTFKIVTELLGGKTQGGQAGQA